MSTHIPHARIEDGALAHAASGDTGGQKRQWQAPRLRRSELKDATLGGTNVTGDGGLLQS
jgi:hypothetical protein